MEQPKLKSTRPITVVKPKKKTKRRSQEEILLSREGEKKAIQRKNLKNKRTF